MSAADGQRLCAVAEPDLVLAVRGLFHAFDAIERNQGAAMDTDEAVRKLRGEFFERFVDEIFAVRVAHRDVFLIGLKEPDVVEGDQAQFSAATRADIVACRGSPGIADEGIDLRAGRGTTITGCSVGSLVASGRGLTMMRARDWSA